MTSCSCKVPRLSCHRAARLLPASRRPCRPLPRQIRQGREAGCNGIRQGRTWSRRHSTIGP